MDHKTLCNYRWPWWPHFKINVNLPESIVLEVAKKRKIICEGPCWEKRKYHGALIFTEDALEFYASKYAKRATDFFIPIDDIRRVYQMGGKVLKIHTKSEGNVISFNVDMVEEWVKIIKEEINKYN